MITDSDIKRLMAAFKEYSREELASKADINDLKEDLSTLQTSVDNFVNTMTKHDEEIKIINHRLDELENPAT